MKTLPLAVLLSVLLFAAFPAAAITYSPKLGSVEIGLSQYLPDIDSEFSGGAHPYKDIFGSGRGWAFRFGISGALYSGVAGQLELGVKSGFFRDHGKGLIPNADGTFVKSGDSTNLNIVPTSLMLTYRVDTIPERFYVPLAPYVRVALDRYNWWVTDGAGNWSKKGATNGWSATGGLALMLDFFDPGLARELDQETGINHTYLFFDATYTSIDDFGSKKSWDLSNKGIMWTGGLMFVF